MSKKILIVDDDLFIREAYQELFTSEGYAVDVASDGKAGLDMIMSTPYDLVILDVMLPQLDGLGILTKLKEKKPPHQVGPIILFTSLSHDPAVKKGLELGAHSILIKPEVTPDFMLSEVKKLTSLGH